MLIVADNGITQRVVISSDAKRTSGIHEMRATLDIVRSVGQALLTATRLFPLLSVIPVIRRCRRVPDVRTTSIAVGFAA